MLNTDNFGIFERYIYIKGSIICDVGRLPCLHEMAKDKHWQWNGHNIFFISHKNSSSPDGQFLKSSHIFPR